MILEITPTSTVALAKQMKARARDLGFDLVAITTAEPSRHREYLRDWLDQGKAGTMEYLTHRFEERIDPGSYFPGARTVICVAKNYFFPLTTVEAEPQVPQGRIARYALGDDYHESMKLQLRALADWLREQVPGAQTRCCVDTAPVLERELAARAGIGWIGKNTLVINPDLGSWILLGELLTTIDFPIDQPATDHCGACRRCIDACPTGAIEAPYQLDARRCISYLTIEHRAEIPVGLENKIGDWLYGCDICQDVCPWNRRATPTEDQSLQPRFPSGTLDVNTVSDWTPLEYQIQLRHSAMKRVKLPVLKRNASLVARNKKGCIDLVDASFPKDQKII